LRQATNTHATPIVRQIDLIYHTKWKTNKVFNLNKSLE
jgi:hypothetical protein